MKEYDLIIIGGGAAGFAAANTANKLKKRTLIINDSNILPLGGTCVNVGCVPTKIMLYQANLFYYSTKNKFRAIKLQGKADFIEALKETKEMVKGFQESNYRNVIKKQEYVDFKEGSGSFIDSHTIKVGNQEFKAKYILISTGASVFVPEIKGIEYIDYITNVNIFSLDKALKSVIIIGGGAMSMEFSQIFHHFGIKVTILQRSERVLSKIEPLIGERVKQDFEKQGIKIYTKTSIKELQNTEKGVKAIIEVNGDEKTIFAEKLMLASGISPHTKDINIENSKINLSKRGFVEINEYMQTSQENIYAAGDVNGIMPLETVAAKQGNLAVLNMFENANKKLNYETIPRAIFTSPEIAVVGITEDESMERYNNCLCSTIEMKNIEKALAIKETSGFIKMVLEPDTKRIIGVHIYSHMAADIITTGVYAIENKMTIYDIRDIVHVFPTMSEMIKKAAQSFEQNLEEMACCVE